MNLRYFLSLALLSSIPAILCRGQSTYIGLQAGIGIPNLQSGSNSTPLSEGYSSRLGPCFGVFADLHLSKRFSLQPEINYSSQGGKKNGRQAIPADQFNPAAQPGTYYYANYNSVARLNYLEIPLLAKFSFPIKNHWALMVDLGPYAGYLLAAHNLTSGSSKVYADPAETIPLTPSNIDFSGNSNIQDQLYKGNFGLQGGLALARMTTGGYFFLQAGGNYGLIDIQKNSVDGRNRTGAATLVLGYAMEMGNE